MSHGITSLTLAATRSRELCRNSFILFFAAGLEVAADTV